MIGTDQSQLKTFCKQSQTHQEYIIARTPSLLSSQPQPAPRPAQVNVWQTIFSRSCQQCQPLSWDHERCRELSRVNFGWIKRVAGGSILLLMFDNNALYLV